MPHIGLLLLPRHICLPIFGRPAQRHKISSAVPNCGQEVISGTRFMEMQFDLNIVAYRVYIISSVSVLCFHHYRISSYSASLHPRPDVSVTCQLAHIECTLSHQWAFCVFIIIEYLLTQRLYTRVLTYQWRVSDVSAHIECTLSHQWAFCVFIIIEYLRIQRHYTHVLTCQLAHKCL